jgi:hypothetical protein
MFLPDTLEILAENSQSLDQENTTSSPADEGGNGNRNPDQTNLESNNDQSSNNENSPSISQDSANTTTAEPEQSSNNENSPSISQDSANTATGEPEQNTCSACQSKETDIICDLSICNSTAEFYSASDMKKHWTSVEEGFAADISAT